MSPASTRSSLSPQVWALLCFLDPLPLSSQPPPEPLEDAEGGEVGEHVCVVVAHTAAAGPRL